MVNEKEQKTVCGTVLVGGTVTNLSMWALFFNFLIFRLQEFWLRQVAGQNRLDGRPRWPSALVFW